MQTAEPPADDGAPTAVEKRVRHSWAALCWAPSKAVARPERFAQVPSHVPALRRETAVPAPTSAVEAGNLAAYRRREGTERKPNYRSCQTVLSYFDIRRIATIPTPINPNSMMLPFCAPAGGAFGSGIGIIGIGIGAGICCCGG